MNDTEFFEPCTNFKDPRSYFPNEGGKRATRIQDLIHSDICGKLKTKYMLKQKSEVFVKFL